MQVDGVKRIPLKNPAVGTCVRENKYIQWMTSAGASYEATTCISRPVSVVSIFRHPQSRIPINFRNRDLLLLQWEIVLFLQLDISGNE